MPNCCLTLKFSKEILINEKMCVFYLHPLCTFTFNSILLDDILFLEKKKVGNGRKITDLKFFHVKGLVIFN